MWTFLTRMFRKNTKICDQCSSAIDPKRDAAICLQSDEFEVYICEACAERLWMESLNDDMFEELKIAEDRDNYTE